MSTTKKKMPKIKKKPKKALKKRISKITASGKIKRGRANTSHNAQTKTSKQTRQARKSTLMSKSDIKRVKSII